MLQGRALTLALTLSLKKCLTCIPSVVLVKVHGIAEDLVRVRVRVRVSVSVGVGVRVIVSTGLGLGSGLGLGLVLRLGLGLDMSTDPVLGSVETPAIVRS
tara:strand:+ start:80 stop:379 length:300 start_codon:yes stop_codon:yes gene_type:complete